MKKLLTTQAIFIVIVINVCVHSLCVAASPDSDVIQRCAQQCADNLVSLLDFVARNTCSKVLCFNQLETWITAVSWL